MKKGLSTKPAFAAKVYTAGTQRGWTAAPPHHVRCASESTPRPWTWADGAQLALIINRALGLARLDDASEVRMRGALRVVLTEMEAQQGDPTYAIEGESEGSLGEPGDVVDLPKL